MGALALVTGPTSEPVTLAEARAQCRVTHTYHDVQLAHLILAAREWAQGVARRAFMPQTWDYHLDEFPSVIELPMAPVQSVTSVKYYSGGAQQTLSPSTYQSDLYAAVQKIAPASGYTWPGTDDRYGAVTVRFVAGYAPGHPDLLTIRQAILLHIEAHYDPENREKNLQTAELLLSPLRIVRV